LIPAASASASLSPHFRCANECERIGAIPEEKLDNAFRERAKEGVLNTVAFLFDFARPFWKVATR
jgi:hypothetical protein